MVNKAKVKRQSRHVPAGGEAPDIGEALGVARETLERAGEGVICLAGDGIAELQTAGLKVVVREGPGDIFGARS